MIDSNDPAVHVDLAHEKLAAIDSGSVPQMTAIVAGLRHLAHAMRLAFGSAVAIVPVDNEAVDAAQAAAIANTANGDPPLAFVAAQTAPVPPPAPEDPDAPKCSVCYHVAGAPIHVDVRDANRHDFVAPAPPQASDV